MKHLTNYISEAIRITANTRPHKDKDMIRPISTFELEDIVKERLKEDNDADLNDIDVSNITNMQELFQGLDPHNIKIDKWDVSHVWNMKYMFSGCMNFNADISDWDVKNVETANYMFANCKKFNSDISYWKLNSLKWADNMFFNCKSFDKDLSLWDWSSVVAENAFSGCDKLDDAYFPQNYVDEKLQNFPNNYISEAIRITAETKPHKQVYTEHPKTRNKLVEILKERLKEDPNANLNNIDVSAIKDMSYLFVSLDPHNIKIDQWCVSKVEDMTAMFNGCKNFNVDISDWDVKNVKYMNYMFDGCKKFDQDLSLWQLPNIKYSTRYLNVFTNTPIENKPEKQPHTPNLK